MRKLLSILLTLGIMVSMGISASATDKVGKLSGNNVGELDPSMVSQRAIDYIDICHKKWTFNSNGYRSGAYGWTNIINKKDNSSRYHYSNLHAYSSLTSASGSDIYSGRKWGYGEVEVQILSTATDLVNLNIYYGW